MYFKKQLSTWKQFIRCTGKAKHMILKIDFDKAHYNGFSDNSLLITG
jgi:hypothetical protein